MIKLLATTETIATYLEMDLFSTDTKERVNSADIILVPDIGKIEGIAKAFRPDTKTFYKFALANNPTDKKIELLENEGELNVLNFHSHEVWLPIMHIRNKEILTTVMEIVNQYVSDKQKRKKEDELVINLNIKVENSEKGTCTALSFKGQLNDLNGSIAELDMAAL